MKISDRFIIRHKLGQGTFSKLSLLTIWLCLGYIYEAYDKVLKQDVAIKVEKKDKNKNILIFEYQVLNQLKGKTPQPDAAHDAPVCRFEARAERV